MIRVIRILGLFVAVCTTRPLALSAMSVEDAYQKIPHDRTRFDSSDAGVSTEARAFLQNLFNLVDRGILARVEKMLWLMKRDQERQNFSEYQGSENYATVIAECQALNPPSDLRSVHSFILAAMKEQNNYLSNWASSPPGEFKFALHSRSSAAPEVSRASGSLIQAYQGLMSALPKANEQNKKAFYNYLCALDFL